LAHATRSVCTVDLFALVPALELRFEPELAELDRLLDVGAQIIPPGRAEMFREFPT
jgi:hypothetical protein